MTAVADNAIVEEPTDHATDRAGSDFGHSVATIELQIEGMTCASCVRRVERTLMKVPNVSDAGVNLATERAVITGHPVPFDLLAAVEKIGYHAKLVQPERKRALATLCRNRRGTPDVTSSMLESALP